MPYVILFCVCVHVCALFSACWGMFKLWNFIRKDPWSYCRGSINWLHRIFHYLVDLTAVIVPTEFMDFWSTTGCTRFCGLMSPWHWNPQFLAHTSNLALCQDRKALDTPLKDHMLFSREQTNPFCLRPTNTWQRNIAVIIYPSSCSLLHI